MRLFPGIEGGRFGSHPSHGSSSRGKRWTPGVIPWLWPGIVRQVHHDRRRGAPHDHPVKRLGSRWIDLHVQQEGRHMDEIAGLRARSEFPPLAPADLADAGQHVGDRLLLSVMMDAGTGPRLDLEQAAPQRRLDADLRCDRGQARGARRLSRSRIESGRADDANGGGSSPPWNSWLQAPAVHAFEMSFVCPLQNTGDI